jgi:hypothetical protein
VVAAPRAHAFLIAPLPLLKHEVAMRCDQVAVVWRERDARDFFVVLKEIKV